MNSRRLTSPLLAATAIVALLAGCKGSGPTQFTKPHATAALMPTTAMQPNPTLGNVAFTALPQGVRVAGEVRGLAPGSEHGFHVHEKGDCSGDGTAAGGHFNPGGAQHGKFGMPGGHAGDLPTLVADDKGVAPVSVEVPSISLTEGAANNVVGRALVVHRDRDDFVSQPAGNAGPRIACALIRRG